MDVDASGTAIGAVLSQIQNDKEVVVRYASKYFSQDQARYCTTKRELLGLVWALKTFRFYLHERHFLVRTDHASIRWWRTMDAAMPDVILRWLQYASSFDFEVAYRP